MYKNDRNVRFVLFTKTSVNSQQCKLLMYKKKQFCNTVLISFTEKSYCWKSWFFRISPIVTIYHCANTAVSLEKLNVMAKCSFKNQQIDFWLKCIIKWVDFSIQSSVHRLTGANNSMLSIHHYVIQWSAKIMDQCCQ